MDKIPFGLENCDDNAVQNFNQYPENDLEPILRNKVEIAVAALGKLKSTSVDNIPAAAELIQEGRDAMIYV